jgi:hypothetical protein
MSRPGAFAWGVQGRHMRVQPQPDWDMQIMSWRETIGRREKGRAMGRDFDAAESNYASRGGANVIAWFA